MATGLDNGKGQNLTEPAESTPFNRWPKIIKGDYVGDPHVSAKFGANPFTEAFVQMCET